MIILEIILLFRIIIKHIEDRNALNKNLYIIVITIIIITIIIIIIIIIKHYLGLLNIKSQCIVSIQV